MGNKVMNIAVIILAGTIIADLVAHAQGTKTVLDSLGAIWGNSLNAVGGK